MAFRVFFRTERIAGTSKSGSMIPVLCVVPVVVPGWSVSVDKPVSCRAIVRPVVPRGISCVPCKNRGNPLVADQRQVGWHIRFRIILRFPECGQVMAASIKFFFVSGSTMLHLPLRNAYIPTMPDRKQCGLCRISAGRLLL